MPEIDQELADWQAEKRAEIEKRQERAYRLLLTFQQRGGDDDNLTAIGDLLTDLLHLADQYGMIDPQHFIERALGHYHSERTEAGIED